VGAETEDRHTEPFPTINLKCVSSKERRYNKVTENKEFIWI
jgi:hypothetical protein